jgi:structural maintenance of chromosome 4
LLVKYIISKAWSLPQVLFGRGRTEWQWQIDAMLFVFGKRAKQLRLHKVSELIHKSPNYPNLPYARVRLYFHEIIDRSVGGLDDDKDDNGECYTVVDHSTVVVSRTAKRDNTSTYQLNGRNCQFKDVAQYLQTKGIDLDHNQFLILQGEVEMISMMPPMGKNDNDNDGLLEYWKILLAVTTTLQASILVETLTEQRLEKLQRVKSVEQEKSALQGAQQEALALLSKDRQICLQQNILYQMNVQEATIEVTK